MVVLKKIFYLAALLTFVFPLHAERLPVKTYTVADGLIHDIIHQIKQDSRGFLWFCTPGGISRFDGYAFTNFTVADGLPPGKVNDFLEAKDGTIYLATDGGLAKLNPTGIRSSIEDSKKISRTFNLSLFTIIPPENVPAVQVLYEDSSGKIWVGTSSGLYQLNASGEKLEAVDLGESKNEDKRILVTAIIKDPHNALWIGTEGSGLFRLAADGRVTQFTIADGLPGNLITSFLADHSGQLWAGMRVPSTAGLIQINTNADDSTSIVTKAFTSADGLPTHWISSLLETSDGHIWLGTTKGLCEWQSENGKSVFRTYRAENDLCDMDVWSLAEDKNGNLWTGSMCGAKKIARYGFTTYGIADGISTVQPKSIFENRDGQLFTDTIDGTRKIYRFDDGKFTVVSLQVPLNDRYIGWGWNQMIRQDSSGSWLIPNETGLYKFPPQTKFENLAGVVPQKISPATKGTEVFRLYEDSHNDLWIGTNYGGNELWQWERKTNTWHNYGAQISPPADRLVMGFAEDKSGNLWIGTGADTGGGELIRYHDGEFKIFTEADGVPNGWMRDLYVDGAGRLWIANSKNGVLRLDDVNADKLNFTRYSIADGLSSMGANCITDDAFGRIYIGGPRGIDRLNPATGQIENFTTADGLPSSYVEISYRDRQNNLWFGTAGGLTKYVPEPERKRSPPTALITALKINGEPQSVSVLGESEIPNIELNSDQKQVSVDFLGLGASLGENLKYEYRLGSSDWTPTTERTVNFANLAAGAYQFQIRAITADRIYSPPAMLAFHITAPIYLRPWFLLAAILLTGSLVFLIYRYRVSRLLEMERIRTRIATDLHDDIGANLTRISMLSEVAKQTAENGSGKLLTSIADIARESVASMNDIVWAIAPEHDSFLDLTRRMRQHAEEVFALRDIDLIFNAPLSDADLKLSVGVRRDTLLIFKEAVNNAARHSNCAKVEINFSVEKSVLILQIKDNGEGFTIDPENGGHGLRSMERRAGQLGGILRIDSRKGGGTFVEFNLPLPKISRI